MSRVEEVLNEWKLIGNSEGKCLPEKVCICHLVINPEQNVSRIFIFTRLFYTFYSLSQGEFTSGIWEEKFEEITFADFKFDITHHFLKQDDVKIDQKEEPEEGIVIYLLTFMEKKMHADG